MENTNVLSQHFTLKPLMRYVLPTIFMMIISSMYMIIDGLFVSNLVGEDALAAINIISPLFGIMMSVSLMFATGGTAIIGRLMGEGKTSLSRQFLSTLYVIATVLGVVITLLGLFFPEAIVNMLGAKGTLWDYSYDYLIALSPFVIAIFFQIFAQSFLVVAGKPGLGFVLTILGGVTNVVLDYVLISPHMFDLGITGAALATGLGATVSGIAGLILFLADRKGTLYFEKPLWSLRLIKESMTNGASELIGNLSASVTIFLMNVILLDLAGQAGVAAISVILYVQMIQNALYFGYAIGIAPIISYKYGEQNHTELKALVAISLKVIVSISVIVVIASLLFAEAAVGIFISPDSSTFEMAVHGFRLFSFAYLFNGFNIFLSSLFTALSNGKVSAILSITRTLVLLVGMLMLLPLLIGINGVWLSVPVAEALALCVGIYFYRKHQRTYHYA